MTQNYVDASPTKQFFMQMLTRDIELKDAILDLLDNCLDGVVRIKKPTTTRNTPDFYKGYKADIEITSKSFRIKDNCGGIPKDTALQYAFKMGHDPKENSPQLPTVGIYGIGMKRAIFKIGKESIVQTKHLNDTYQVKIDNNWAASSEWRFPLQNLDSDKLSTPGTVITITDLTDEVAAIWENKYSLELFIEELKNAVSTNYSLIISKGFEITLNGEKISPEPMNLLFSEEKEGIKPYIYTYNTSDLNVSLAVGFYAKPPSEQEISDENESKRASKEAGWSVICNDRVIVYNDRTSQTGWGEAGVPKYHTQFIGIRGIVVFESNKPNLLPMTTTKRGLNLSSELYAEIKNKMREGMKLFTNYTNHWKGLSEKLADNFKSTKQVSCQEIFQPSQNFQDKYHAPLKKTRGQNAYIFKPHLSKPESKSLPIRISYTKSPKDYEIVKNYYREKTGSEHTPSEIGSYSFDEILNISIEQE